MPLTTSREKTHSRTAPAGLPGPARRPLMRLPEAETAACSTGPALVFLLGAFCACLVFSGCRSGKPDSRAAGARIAVTADSSLRVLAEEFFRWRSVHQPVFEDDINRIERPAGWVPDWSPETLIEIRNRAHDFMERLESLPRMSSVSDSVDFLLLRSAIERVRWENDVLRLPRRNAQFYVQQTLGALFEALLLPAESTSWNDAILLQLRTIPRTLACGRMNLEDPAKPFAVIAIENLDRIRDKMRRTVQALLPHFPEGQRPGLAAAADSAATALEEFAAWLSASLANMDERVHPGKEAFEHYLRRIALIPYPVGEILTVGRDEFGRAAAFELLEKHKNRRLPPLPAVTSADDMIRNVLKCEQDIRAFIAREGLITLPPDFPHFTAALIPDFLEPLQAFGALYDMTGPSRRDENPVRYLPEPSLDLPFFFLSMLKDPRPVIVHEGIPGHYCQMALSWRHPDPVRRFYIDSGPNEGIGFFLEEMLLQAGLFDDRPRVREIIAAFMRLRALRVEVDVRLALGTFTIDEAAGFLAEKVPMDRETAVGEARFFASTPGQALTYQIGKCQILRYLSDAKSLQGGSFDLRRFLDDLLLNGNVPIALQRWERLGKRDEIPLLWE